LESDTGHVSEGSRGAVITYETQPDHLLFHTFEDLEEYVSELSLINMELALKKLSSLSNNSTWKLQ
jgi:hypothetical protein